MISDEAAATRVLARRKAERGTLVNRARTFVESLDPTVAPRAAAIFGSVARGDFNRWSDIDLLLVSDDLPHRWLDRLDLLEPRPPGVQPHPWTTAEWRTRLAKGDPMAREAVDKGIWLVGSAAELELG